MQDTARYTAHMPDKNGYITYSDEENAVWSILYDRQMKLIQGRSCPEYLQGIETLQMTYDKIPQPVEISARLKAVTGWSVEPVPALINFKRFFQLLADKKFPAASFIRRREDLDYLPEPDIFHEIFGHCPLLTEPSFAAFTQEVGKFGLTLGKDDRVLLARLYWFTVEFGLINTQNGLRIYGAGILSSKTESFYALESDIPIRKPFDVVEALRMPYRYDELQKIYYTINSFEELYNMIDGDKLLKAFNEAKRLGLLPELFTNVENNQNVVNQFIC